MTWGLRVSSLIAKGFARAERIRESIAIDVRTAGSVGTVGGGGFSGPGGGGMGASGFGTSFGRYTQTPAHNADQYGYFQGYPYAIINTIANRLAAQPIRVARLLPAGERARKRYAIKSVDFVPKSLADEAARLEVFPDHKITRCIDDPNPMMVRHHLLYMTYASMEITGRAYWWMFQDEASGKFQIWPVPSHWIEPVHTETRLFAYYRVSLPGTGEPIKVPTRQIVPFMFADPSDPFSALAPMQAMARTVMTDFAIELAQRMGFENGVNPGLAIIVGKTPEMAGIGGDQMVLTQEQRNQMVAAVKRQFRGVTRFDEPMILDALIKDVKPITTSPREMAFKESSTLTRNRMTQGWSMNPITLGEIEGVNYASSGVADHHVCRNVYQPRTEANSQTMTCYVPPFFGISRNDDMRIVVYQEPVQPSDPEMDMNRDWGDYDRGIISRNDMRQKRGKPPVADGDIAYVGGNADGSGGGWVTVDPHGEDTGNPAIGDGHDHDDQDDDKRPAGRLKRGHRLTRPRRKVTDGSGHEHDTDGRFGHGGGGGGGGSDGASTAADTGKVDDHNDAHDKRAKALFGKIKKYGAKAVSAAKAVKDKATDLAYHATWAVAAAGVSADDIADTTHDYSKMINAKGVGDWLSTHIGVSGNTAAVVASHVIAYGLVKLKKAIKARREAEKAAGRPLVRAAGRKGGNTLAHGVTDVVHAFLPKLGCPHDQLPSLKDVEKWLAKRKDFTDKKPGRPFGWGRWDTVEWRILRKAVNKASSAIDQEHELAIRRLRRGLRPVFEKLGQRAAAQLRKELVNGGEHFSAAELAGGVIESAHWERTLAKELGPLLFEAALSGAALEWGLFKDSRKSAKGLGAVLRGLPKRVVQAAKHAAQKVMDDGLPRAIANGVINGIKRAIRRGRKDGLARTDLADYVTRTTLTGDAAAQAAKTVALNHGAATVNGGQDAVRTDLIRGGAVAVTEWVTAEDEKVRAAHRKAHGQRVRPGKAFFVGGEHAYYPGDLSLSPANRCNCRCKAVTIYVQHEGNA